jgi:hypothetical protein
LGFVTPLQPYLEGGTGRSERARKVVYYVLAALFAAIVLVVYGDVRVLKALGLGGTNDNGEETGGLTAC